MGKRKSEQEPNVLLSSEKHFVFREGYNKGFSQTPRMVTNCIDLSDQAKTAYGVIAGYIFEHGRAAFPSIGRVAMACNCSRRRAIEHINELVAKGFVLRIRKGKGNTNDYYLVDMDKVKHLRVSEMFWKVADAITKKHELLYSWDAVQQATYKIVKHLKDSGLRLDELEPTEGMRKQLEKEYINVLGGSEPKMVFVPKNKKTTPSIPDEKEKGKVTDPNHWSNRPIERWTRDNFREYFYYQYGKATDLVHPNARAKHIGMMGNCLRRAGNSKDLLKQQIDAFFEMGYDIPSLENFANSARLAEVNAFIAKGTLPFFLTSKGKEKQGTAKEMPKTQENKGLDKGKFLEMFGGGQDDRFI